EKHLTSSNIVADMFNIIDDNIDYYRVSNFNKNILDSTSTKQVKNINLYNYIFNPSYINSYWKQWSIGSRYRFSVEISEQEPIFIKETNKPYFVLKISSEVPSYYEEIENEVFITDLK